MTQTEEEKKEYMKIYRKKNREKIAKQRKEYRESEEGKKIEKEYKEKNREKILKDGKEYRESEEGKKMYEKWYEKNKEILAEKQKVYNENNKEKIAEQRKENYENNKEEILKQQKEYYEKNREKILEQCKEYRVNNIEKKIKVDKNYRKSKQGRENRWIKQHGMKIFEDTYDKYEKATHCESCDVELTKKGGSRKCLDHDHISGYVRFICCNNCNNKFAVKDRLLAQVHLEFYRYMIYKESLK
jgi:hypothetical protein